MKKLILVLATLSLPVQAENIHFGGWSKHLGGGENNETHKLLALEKDNFIVGRFKNSHSKTSMVVGYNFQSNTNHFNYGLTLGGVTGYEDKMPEVIGVTPAFIPFVSYNKYFIKPQFMLLGNAAVLSFKIGF